MKLAFVRGQTFLPGEQNTVIASESAARAIWPNQDPVGKTWTFAGADRTVVGVVKDSGANLLADAESIEVYIPLEGPQIQNAALILHSPADPAPLLRLIPSAVDGVHQTAVISLMRAGRENYIRSMSTLATLIGSIGAVASALAAAGMFALVAFAVAQRRREFGIRIAIGARPRHILALLLAQNARPVLIGSIVGSVLAVVLSRVVRSEIPLQGRDAVDPAGFALGLGCFLVIATLAALSPALRALKIDPAATLRDE